MLLLSKTVNSIFGKLELRSFNLFLFYLTSVVFSMYWKSRRGKCSGLFLFTIWIKRQSKIAREVKFARIAHGWQFYRKVPGCWKWRACWKNRKVCGDLFFVIWIFADFKAETSRKNSRYWMYMYCDVQKLKSALRTWQGSTKPKWEQRLLNFSGPKPNIVGFHMTSLKFKLKSYRCYRDFTFTMH